MSAYSTPTAPLIPPPRGGIAAPAGHARRDETLRTLQAFEEAGITVFPASLGRKGSYVEGWPSLRMVDALARTRRDLARKPINLSGRTGDGWAVIDLDDKDGARPDEMLPVLCARLQGSIFAIVKTRRGYHIWVRVRESVGNGYCAFIGGEVFSGPHLAMLPPSKHPDGGEYEWVVPPQPTAGLVPADLRAIGLVPEASSRAASESSNGSRLVPAPPDVQQRFAALMASLGLHKTSGRPQMLVRCPWHDDHSPSLSVNWEAAVFCCFGSSCELRGGLKALKDLVGDTTPTYRQRNPGLAEDESYGDKSGCFDADAHTARLVAAFQRLGLHERAQAVGDCRQLFRFGKCTNCGRNPAYPISCGDPLCLRCMPGRLAADWERRRDALPRALDVYRLRPPGVIEGDGLLRRVRTRFNDWRKRTGITGGLYGIRLERERGAAILLAVPAGMPAPISTRAFQVEAVAREQSTREFARWLQQEYVDEAQAWSTDEELARLVRETKGRRRFQGFGTFYDDQEAKEESMQQESEQAAPKKKALGRISGGALRGKRTKEPTHCTYCGGDVELYSYTVSADRVRRVGNGWLFNGPPEVQRGA